jgi:hypothetical protein
MPSSADRSNLPADRSSGNLHAIVRPGASMRTAIGILNAQRPKEEVLRLERILEDTASIEGLATLLTQGIEHVTTKDGRLDTRDLAAFVLAEMRKYPK